MCMKMLGNINVKLKDVLLQQKELQILIDILNKLMISQKQ